MRRKKKNKKEGEEELEIKFNSSPVLHVCT
jgi:hypothetical protein